VAATVVATPVLAQEAADGSGPVTPDSADAIRQSLERPPGTPPFDAVDAVALPFRIVVLPLAVLGRANAKIVAFAVEALRPREISLLDQLAAEGFRPRFGSLGSRSGIAAGVRFERWPPLYLEAGYSIRQSQEYTAGLEFTNGPNRFETHYQWRRWAEPHFWGIGPDTKEDEVVDYLWDHQEVVVGGTIVLNSATLTPSAGFEDNQVGRGKDPDTPDIQDVPGADSVYGVKERVKYAVMDLQTSWDRTFRRGFQTRGTYLELGTSLYLGVDGTDSDFVKVRGLLNGYVPINLRQLLAVRVIGEINRGRGQGVPFYHLARVGDVLGGRAFNHDRFRDLDAIGFMSEWRYEVWRELHETGRAESFLLLDTGAVKDRLFSIRLSDFRWSVGVGMRLIFNNEVRWLVSVAYGRDGARLDVSFTRVW
jgi:hypothetical protein